jgi:predicted HicB family RNase H-like nuclease
MTTHRKTHRTKDGRTLTAADIDALADELANADYDLDAVKARPVGRPRMGSAPAISTQIRLDPEMRAALDQAARQADVSVSEVVRRALRQYLEAS